MTEVYLITGFLGAGKTCFVKNMVKELTAYFRKLH